MTAVAPIQTPSPASIQRLLQDWCDLWRAGELAPEISVEFSSRMTRSLGRCYPDRNLVRIAKFVVEESDALFQEVLCHEAAHLAAYHLHGTSIPPHGPEWKALMQMAGYSPSAKFKGQPLSGVPATATKSSLVDSVLESLQNALLRKVNSPALERQRS